MGKLRDKMAEDLELRCYKPGTCDAYLRCATKFAEHYMTSPESMGEEQIRKYLLHLKLVKKSGLGALKMSVAALKFLYTQTLDRPEEVIRIPWPKTPKPLPVILSGTEVLSLLESLRPLQHRMVVMTAYGMGLRISEACRLSVDDIDSARMMVHVRNGKRGRDRYLMLPERLLVCLRGHWKTVRPPGPWLFPGRAPGTHIGAGAVRKALHKATDDAGIKKRVTPHILRGSFATHLLESGVDIRTIQALLGHGSIRTTEHYVQVSRAHIGRVQSPLDVLGTEEGKKKLG